MGNRFENRFENKNALPKKTYRQKISIWKRFSTSYSIMQCEVTSVMSDSVWPRRQQPTRLPNPWDSPAKNTGVGCHFLLHHTALENSNRNSNEIPLHTFVWIAKIQNTGNTKCWWEWRAIRTLIHCWWEGKMVHSLWKTVWQFLTKLNIILPYDLAIMLLDICPNGLKTCTHTKSIHQWS